MLRKNKYIQEPDVREIRTRECSANLELWRDLNDKTNMRLVHCVADKYFNLSELMTRKAEQVFSQWDVFSCSLITDKALLSKDGTISYSGMYSDIGFILDVKPQNILGTHSHDVYFDNHIGTKNHSSHLRKFWPNSKDSWKLADSIFSGIGKKLNVPGLTIDKEAWPFSQGNPYNMIESPENILSKSNRKAHNEILIIGKPGVSLYRDYPPTQEIKVKSLAVTKRIRTPKERDEIMSIVEKILAVNPQILYTLI